VQVAATSNASRRMTLARPVGGWALPASIWASGSCQLPRIAGEDL
jgi:hypothetical protein